MSPGDDGDSTDATKEEVQRLKVFTEHSVLPVAAFAPPVSIDNHKLRGVLLAGGALSLLACVLLLTAVVVGYPASLACTFRPSACPTTAAAVVIPVDAIKDNVLNTTTIHLMVGTDASEAFAVEDGGGVFRRHEDGAVAPALSIVREFGYE